MLYSFNDVCRCRIRASAGLIGSLRDLYCHARTWGIAFVGVRSDSSVGGELTLVPRAAFGNPDWVQDELVVTGSRQRFAAVQENEAWQSGSTTLMDASTRRSAAGREPRGVQGVIDPPRTEVASARELVGRRLETADGPVGEIADLLFDSERWSIRYLQVALSEHGAENRLVPAGKIAKVEPYRRALRTSLGRRELANCSRLEPVEDVRSPGARLLVIRSGAESAVRR